MFPIKKPGRDINGSSRSVLFFSQIRRLSQSVIGWGLSPNAIPYSVRSDKPTAYEK